MASYDVPVCEYIATRINNGTGTHPFWIKVIIFHAANNNNNDCGRNSLEHAYPGSSSCEDGVPKLGNSFRTRTVGQKKSSYSRYFRVGKVRHRTWVCWRKAQLFELRN